MKQAYEILIYGKVQGVFFRHNTKKKADELGIEGYVKNMPDGSVKIVAMAGNDNMQEFLDWCRKGPSSAEVDDIEYSKVSADKGYDGFKVHR